MKKENLVYLRKFGWTRTFDEIKLMTCNWRNIQEHKTEKANGIMV